jgi:lauroyl/myristoyl acyltransferase
MNPFQRPDYRQRADRLRASIVLEITQLLAGQAIAPGFSNAYHMADANLRYFFPQHDAAQRRAIIADLFFQQTMSLADQAEPDLLPVTRVIDPERVFAADAAPQARIFCTYHAGSYRHLFQLLMDAGRDCVLFLSPKTREEQGEQFYRDLGAVAHANGWRGRMVMQDAQDRNSLLYGLRALKRGQSLVIYIDGNAGIGANRHSDKLVEADFFGRTILARTGIAYLSHLSGAPIVPVLCARDAALALSLTVHPAIVPGAQAREDYVAATIARLYALLAQEISAAPGQWEGWLYVEKFLKRDVAAPAPARVPREVAPSDLLRANLDDFALLMYGSQPVLLDKTRHSFIMLDSGTADAFRSAAGTPARAEFMSGPGPAQLVRLGALLPVARISALPTAAPMQ